MPNIVILACDCKHAFRDERYGKGNRVHNVGKKNCTCTVCGKSKPISEKAK